MKRTTKDLLPKYFESMPLGAVAPKGILLTQMELLWKNLTSRMEIYDDFSSNSAWLGGTGEGWERGPYYVRGLVGMGYTLNNKEAIKKARKWIDWSLESQRKNGDFGPRSCNDWWAKMPMLMAIKDYYEAEKNIGNYDRRVLPFFDRYFRFQKKYLWLKPLKSWAKFRGADNVYVLYWYYETLISGGCALKDLAWILELAEMLLKQTFDWAKEFNETSVRQHVVNTTQGFRMPHIRYRLSKEAFDKEALRNGLKHISEDHGRIDGLPNADEAARDNLPTRGTETCAVTEGLMSFAINGEITGEGYLFDYMESYCYNALPNCFAYDMRHHNYFQLQNQVLATHGYHGFDCDHGDSSAFGSPAGFECCFSNLHMGYPKFVQHMWMSTREGVAAVCYGACSVEHEISGKKIRFHEETDYPYSDGITFSYEGQSHEFSLLLRVPEWTKAYSVNINGQCYDCELFDGYLQIYREFLPGDVIKLTLQAELEIKAWHCNTQYVQKGAVLFCLPIKEEWRRITTNDFRELKTASIAGENFEVYPAEDWNYTIADAKLEFEQLELQKNEAISPEFPPCRIVAPMRKIEGWKLKGNVADTLDGVTLEGDFMKKYLIPYAYSRLKISCFPREADSCARSLAKSKTVDFINENKGKKKELNIQVKTAFGMVQLEFENANCDSYIVTCKQMPDEKLIVYQDIKFNPYHFSGKKSIIKWDKFAFSIQNNKHYIVRMYGVKGKRITHISSVKKIFHS